MTNRHFEDRRSQQRVRWPCILAAALAAASSVAAAQDALTELTLEELGNITITSVSKRAQPLSDAAASVFVLTRNDIRRSGATSLPEALRLAPNLQVARASANGWAISARGFNGSAANKLLVLIDGRSVYSPLFSGVFWDVQDVVLDDIERIEVISGPAGALWGVNAVNGVVNIITRSSGLTQRGLGVAQLGSDESQVTLRYGGALDGGATYRVYGKQMHRNATQGTAGQRIDDSSRTTQAGFRADVTVAADMLMLSGDVYTGRREQPEPGTLVTGAEFALGDVSVSGGNLLGRWERELAGGGKIATQATFDRVERVVRPTFSQTLAIADVQFQHSMPPLGRHTVAWGAEYRRTDDKVSNSEFVAFLPAHRQQSWASLFIQDEIVLSPSLRATLGARLERNDYTGWEALPSARLSWKPAVEQLLWAGASRTARAPSRLDRDAYVPGAPPYLLAGGPEVDSEKATVYELGYRGQPWRDLSISVTAYRAKYDRLRTQELGSLDPIQVYFGNGMRGTVRGVELWGTFQLRSNWRLHAGFTRLWQDLKYKPGSIDTANSRALAEGANPARQALLRTSYDVSERVAINATARYVSRLSDPNVPSYATGDLRIAWATSDDLEVSLAATNLFGPDHGEFTSETTRTSFSTAVVLGVQARF